MIGNATALHSLPHLLTATGYDQSIIEDVERALNRDDGALIQSRQLLEKFFRVSTQMDKAVRFTGDRTRFGETLGFALDRRWLTETERQFIRALYGLLSDVAAHPGQSLIEPTFARHAVLHSLWLVLNRFQVRPSRPFAGYGGSAGRLRLAESFLKGVRTGIWNGPAFEVDFDQDLMQLARTLLRYADIKPLMTVIKSDEASANLRCNCASLVLSPRCYRKPSDDNWPKVVSDLNRYCSDNLSVLPWQVSRAIALALANRTNHADRLLDYLEWIRQDPKLVDVNLLESDTYNGGIEQALAYYSSRIQNFDIPLSGCVWEAFYISYRSSPSHRNIRYVLKRRLSELAPGRLRSFLQSACDGLAAAGPMKA